MPKIVLAEDDATMLTLLTTLLKLEGFEVVVADISDVPSVVTKEGPEHLLTDVHLAGKNGMDIVKTIRKNPANKKVNIVMTSGLNMKEECLECGANYFLLKPFMPDDLIKLLKN